MVSKVIIAWKKDACLEKKSGRDGDFNSTRQQSSELVQIESICSRQINVAEIKKYLFERVENIVEKEKNAGYQHFLSFTVFAIVLFL